jgi:hypothetical protein
MSLLLIQIERYYSDAYKRNRGIFLGWENKMPRFWFAVSGMITTILTLVSGSIKSVSQSKLIFTVAALLLLGVAGLLQAQTSPALAVVTSSTPAAHDPGVRGGDAGAGGPIAGLTVRQQEFFDAGQDDFKEVETVANGLGPRMNLDSCAGCHFQPAIGGTSPATNPQVAFANKDGGTDRVPYFITVNGPVREARFKFNADGIRDGGVHNTATITGRMGADAGCVLAQPNFAAQAASNNLIFRIPTPVFGAGLIEQIPDSAILANQASNATTKMQLGIKGHANLAVSGRTITGDTNNNRQVRVEGPEPDAVAVFGRGLQRRNGDFERAVPAGARARRGLPVRHGP